MTRSTRFARSGRASSTRCAPTILFLLVLSATLAGLGTVTGGAGGQQAVFRAAVDRVRVDALVTRDGRPVTGLNADDFEVFDNGVRQRIDLSTAAGNVSAVLMLDLSGSARGRTNERFVDAVKTFAAALVPGDTASMMSFSRRLKLDAAAVRDPAAIRNALVETDARGGTAMWDGLVAGASLADRGDTRALAVLLTDGADNYSYLDEKKALECLDRSNVVVYTVWAPPTPQLVARVVAGSPKSLAALGSSPPGRPEGGPLLAAYLSQFKDALSRLAERTGGAVWQADDDLPNQFAKVLQEFRSRYLLVYEPTGVRRDDGWHQLKVRVKDVKGEVKARPGYYAGRTP